MSNLLYAMLVLGLIQGIAEFLPISSSGHLVLFQSMDFFRGSIAGITENSGLFINVTLHFATLIGIIIFLWNDILKILKGALLAVSEKNFKGGDAAIIKNIFISSIPAAALGLFFHDFFENVFSSPGIVFFMLIINGILLISTKKISSKSRKLEEIGLMSAFFIGIFQAIAIIPGISRSGMTITGGMMTGLMPEESARFSFLMAIPVIAGAGFLEAVKAFNSGLSSDIIIPIIIAMFFTVIVSLISLRVLFAVVRKVKLDLFGYYTLLLGIPGVVFYYFF